MNKFEVKQVLAKAKNMDKASDEFSELYFGLNEMYFDFKDPDGYQSAGKVLNLVINKGEEWMVEACAQIANHLFQVVKEKTPAAHGAWEYSTGEKIFYDFYKNKEAIESVHKMLLNAVMVKAEEQKHEQ